MKSKKNIVFLGMMGSGKTSIGKLFSKKLKLDFYDTDELIERELGLSVSEIFDSLGEKKFRELEEKVTLRILNKKSIVISLGGGTFLNKIIRTNILENHLSIWLKWQDEILIKRIKNSLKRPLASKATTKELISLIKKRSNIYSKSLYKVECDNLSKQELLKKVIEIYENN